MRMPITYTPKTITEWRVMKNNTKDATWTHARPLGFDGSIFFAFKTRFNMALKIFTGKYDALDWGE